ncbi:MAG: glutathione S-transferase family protein [Rhizobiales bacterium]|nr:glutathione S-transferase family protein [Hyphomicrobiales bacterium]
MALRELAGLKFYGLDLSYFTGKFEAFLRYKEIPHQNIQLSMQRMRHVARNTGLAQMPAVELPDGRWMSDTSPMIGWIDANMPGPHVVPEDPYQRFFSRLLEDYADEWLWRPALHYRWSFQPDARLLSHRISTEMLHDVPAPLFLRRLFIHWRQLRRYVYGDGITKTTRAHVESVYTRNLAFLEAMLETRPFLLGERPTLADFGFFASMFRHFGLDPTPARIMRDTAPAVFEWLGRMWNAKASRVNGPLVTAGTVPDDWIPVLQDMARCYFPYLNANAFAHKAGKKTFDVTIEGVPYTLPVHRYRVWCLEQLQAAWHELGEPDRPSVQALLEKTEIWPALWQVSNPDSGFDPQGNAPFYVPGQIWAKASRRD